MRARTRNLLLFAAVALIASIAFLLVREGRNPGPGSRGPGTATEGRDDTGPGRTSPPRTSPAGVDASAELPAPEGPRLDLRAVVGGEWGLAGVQVLAVERFRDGSLMAMIGDDAPDGGETDADGRITLRYKAEPAERLFGILPDAAEFESAENAEPVGDIGPFRILGAVDAATGDVLAGMDGIRLAWKVHGPGEEPEDGYEALVEKVPGWLRAWVVDPSAIRDVRLVVPGFLPSPAPEGGWKGRTVVRLEADPGAIRGRIYALENIQIDAVLLSAEDGRPCEAQSLAGLPGRPGPFALSGVPPGKWDLVVKGYAGNLTPDMTAWATARFVYRGEGLDLGDVGWRSGAVLRARLLGRDGKPDTETPLHLARGFPGEVPLLGYGLSHRPPSVQVTWPGRGWQRDVREMMPGTEGWAEFGGLQPGGTYVLATGRVPGLTRSVTMLLEPGDPVVVELDASAPTTTCTLKFTVDGEEPRFWRVLGGPAFADSFKTGEGTLDAEIPPGRYLFVGMTTPEEGSSITTFYAEVEIPDSGRFQGTVDLR